eukprot:12330960-Alexandrium_andersonii.AAC.1
MVATRWASRSLRGAVKSALRSPATIHGPSHSGTRATSDRGKAQPTASLVAGPDRNGVTGDRHGLLL